jgi:hypothetical protein
MTWQDKFRSLELSFFQNPDGGWVGAANRTPNELHANYNDEVHQLHVNALNQELPLGDEIETSDFDGDMPLVRIRDDVVGPRIEP